MKVNSLLLKALIEGRNLILSKTILLEQSKKLIKGSSWCTALQELAKLLPS